MLIHLSLGDVFREAMSISPMDMDVGDDLILGWDWISSHDLQNLFQAGQGVYGRGQISCSLLSSLPPHGPLRRPSQW